jgi:hypothetical protein
VPSSTREDYTLNNLVFAEHKLVWNQTQGKCYILTTQVCMKITQDLVSAIHQHKYCVELTQELCDSLGTTCTNLVLISTNRLCQLVCNS